MAAAITATVTSGTTPPSITLVASGGVGVVQRIQGGVATPVRGTDAAFAGTVLDYEVPQEVSVTYTFAGATSPARTLPDVGVWMVPVGRPELAVQITVAIHDSWDTPAGQDIARTPGRKFPLVVSWGARGGAAGKFEIILADYTAEVALIAALADQAIIWLSSHARHGLGGYMSIGDVGWSRQLSYSRDEARRVALPYVMVDRPEVVDAPAGHRWVDQVGAWAQQIGTWALQ